MHNSLLMSGQPSRPVPMPPEAVEAETARLEGSELLHNSLWYTTYECSSDTIGV